MVGGLNVCMDWDTDYINDWARESENGQVLGRIHVYAYVETET